jgi:hypothetical protein
MPTGIASVMKVGSTKTVTSTLPLVTQCAMAVMAQIHVIVSCVLIMHQKMILDTVNVISSGAAQIVPYTRHHVILFALDV